MSRSRAGSTSYIFSCLPEMMRNIANNFLFTCCTEWISDEREIIKKDEKALHYQNMDASQEQNAGVASNNTPAYIPSFETTPTTPLISKPRR